MSELDYGPIPINDKNILATMELSVQDLVDGGLNEEIARLSIGVDTTRGFDKQLERFAGHPDQYSGGFSDGALKAILKISSWNVLSMEPYARGFGEKIKFRTLQGLGKYALPGDPLGIQAFVASHGVDRSTVLDELLAYGLVSQPNVDIYAPHHSGDAAEQALLNNGFVRTERSAQYVDLPQYKNLTFRQELFLKKRA